MTRTDRVDREGLAGDVPMTNRRTLTRHASVRGAVCTASRAQATRCAELVLLAKAGEITALEHEPRPPYRLEVNGILIGTYRPDHRYRNPRAPAAACLVLEDSKSPALRRSERTDLRGRLFNVKARLMLALYGLTVTVVER